MPNKSKQKGSTYEKEVAQLRADKLRLVKALEELLDGDCYFRDINYVNSLQQLIAEMEQL